MISLGRDPRRRVSQTTITRNRDTRDGALPIVAVPISAEAVICGNNQSSSCMSNLICMKQLCPGGRFRTRRLIWRAALGQQLRPVGCGCAWSFLRASSLGTDQSRTRYQAWETRETREHLFLSQLKHAHGAGLSPLHALGGLDASGHFYSRLW